MLNIYSCRQTQHVECERDFHNIRSLQYTWALITSTLTVQYSCLSVCIRATLLLVYEENKEKQEVAVWLVRMMQSEKEKSMQSIDKVCTLCAKHTPTDVLAKRSLYIVQFQIEEEVTSALVILLGAACRLYWTASWI